MMVLTDKPEVDQTDAALLTKELTEIYSTPTPKGWPKPKKVNDLYLIDCVSFTIAGVQYLYPEPKHESYISTTHYHLWYIKENIPILR
jgi:hypothetical protein